MSKPTYRLIVNGLEFVGSRLSEGLMMTGALKGFGKPSIRTSSFVNSGADGGNVAEQFYDIRRIPVSATLYHRNLTTFEDAMKAIDVALPIRSEVEVILITPAGRSYQLTAKVAQVDVDVINIRVADYNIELLAGDPLIYDYTDGQALEITLMKPLVGGLKWQNNGLNWNTEGETGLFWSPSAKDVNVTNEGTIAVWPVIEITGKATNPEIRNATTNQTVSLNISTTTGDVLEISMKPTLRTVTLNGTSVFNNLNQDNWWPLIPGTNNIQYNSASIDDDAVAKVIWRNGYISIT